MGKDGNPRLALHPRHEPLAAPGHDDVEIAVQSGQHGPDRRPVPGRDEADGVGRQTRLLQAVRDGLGDGVSGPKTLRPGAKHRGIARLEAERRRIRRDVRATLEYDADDAERRCRALDHQSVRPIERREHSPDRIGQGRDALDCDRDVFETARIEGEPIDEGADRTLRPGFRHIVRVRGQDACGPLPDPGCHCPKRRVLLFGRCQGDLAGGLARPDAHFAHQRRNIDRIRACGVESATSRRMRAQFGASCVHIVPGSNPERRGGEPPSMSCVDV